MNRLAGLAAGAARARCSSFRPSLLRTGWTALGCIAVAACSGGGAAVDSNPASTTSNPRDIPLRFAVANDASVARTETVRASVPFPMGGYYNFGNLAVDGETTAWLPMQYWADGSIKVAQAQFTTSFAAGETKQYQVRHDQTAYAGNFTRHAWVEQFAATLRIGAEVRDTYLSPYRAFVDDAAEVLQASPFVQVRRHRGYHTSSDGIGRDYLSSTFYVTEFRDMPFMVVDWVLGNDYLGQDVVPPGSQDPNLWPLGSVDVRSASFLCKGATEVLPYRSSQEGIGAIAMLASGHAAARVMTETYLSDGQSRRYRFLLRFEPQGANQTELDAWRNTAQSMLSHPLFPLATQSTWEDTAAAGLLGGPMAGPANAPARARADYESWAGADHFGTWGTRGDPQSTHTTGTPRNQPLTPELAHAIQGAYPRLLVALEQKAWAQAMRPYHLYGLQVGAEQDILLWNGLPHAASTEQLGREILSQNDPYAGVRTLTLNQPVAHGWNAYDVEHWSTDLLFDYWTISGDEWAKEEMRTLGQALKGSMRLTNYATAFTQAARAEGWCMQSFAQCYQATRAVDLKDYAIRRASEIVNAQRHIEHPSRAIKFQNNYPSTNFPGDHEFYMPWQHGAVLYGYLGGYLAFGEPFMLEIAESVVDTVEYAWITNFQHETLGYVSNGLRYYVPISHNGSLVPANVWDTTPGIGPQLGSNPLGGAHSFLVGGLHLLAAATNHGSVRARAERFGGMLLGTIDDTARWDKWKYCLPRAYQ